MNRSWQDKRLAQLSWLTHSIGVGVVGAVALFAHFGIVNPIMESVRSESSELSRLENIVSQRPRLEREVEQRAKDLATLELRAEQMRERIPDQPNEAQFLNQIADVADTENLTIVDYQRGAVSTFDAYSQVKIRVKGEGEYASICGFLHQLSKLQRVAKIDWMQIEDTENNTVYPVEISLTLYFGHQANTDGNEVIGS